MTTAITALCRCHNGEWTPLEAGDTPDDDTVLCAYANGAWWPENDEPTDVHIYGAGCS